MVKRRTGKWVAVVRGLLRGAAQTKKAPRGAAGGAAWRVVAGGVQGRGEGRAGSRLARGEGRRELQAGPGEGRPASGGSPPEGGEANPPRLTRCSAYKCE